MAVPYVRRAANIERARSLGHRWRMTSSFVAWTVALVAVVLVVDHWLPTLPAQLIVGAMLGSSGMVLALGLARFDDPQVRGLMAEKFTADTLRKQRRWRTVHNLSFADGDIDSVAVTPGGVLAIETKWHGRTRTAQACRRDDLWVTERRATKVRSFLRGAHKLDVPVTPVLVVWGPGAPDLPRGCRITDGVWEVDGDHPELWAPSFAKGPVDAETSVAIVHALAAHQKMRAAHDRVAQTSLRREMWSAFVDGWRADREERRVKRRAREALDRNLASREA